MRQRDLVPFGLRRFRRMVLDQPLHTKMHAGVKIVAEGHATVATRCGEFWYPQIGGLT